jgi:hypothetical protein
VSLNTLVWYASYLGHLLGKQIMQHQNIKVALPTFTS